MSFRRTIIKAVLQQRSKAIDNFRRHPHQVQHEVFRSLIEGGVHTKFGCNNALRADMSMEEFARSVKVYDYDSFKPYIELMLNGEADIACEGRVKMFARSSGTTSDRSKYIPVSESSLHNNHMLGMRDVSTLYHDIFPDSEVLAGKVLTLGGSCNEENGYLVGDLSGLLIKRFSLGSGWLRAPRMDTALLTDFDEKCERICKECTTDNITSFAGVPSWNLALMSRVLEYTGKSSLREVWPGLELFIHGGVEMTPYRQVYHSLEKDLNYMETYNASEGFFAIADDLSRDDMLLMLDYQTYFEFRSNNEIVPLEGVKLGVTYALIITSSNGLWRYEIGDMIEFTSLDPYRIRFAGRTRQYINAFGEEVIVENTDGAIVKACEKMDAVIGDYMVAPKFMSVGERGCHQWLIEFIRHPSDINTFVECLDNELRKVNSDYDAKRGSTLDPPHVSVLESGIFLKWMRARGKNKVPRLSNDRVVIENIINWIDSQTID